MQGLQLQIISCISSITLLSLSLSALYSSELDVLNVQVKSITIIQRLLYHNGSALIHQSRLAQSSLTTPFQQMKLMGFGVIRHPCQANAWSAVVGEQRWCNRGVIAIIVHGLVIPLVFANSFLTRFFYLNIFLIWLNLDCECNGDI